MKNPNIEDNFPAKHQMLCFGGFLLIPAPFCFLPIAHAETLRGQANTLDREVLMADSTVIGQLFHEVKVLDRE